LRFLCHLLIVFFLKLINRIEAATEEELMEVGASTKDTLITRCNPTLDNIIQLECPQCGSFFSGNAAQTNLNAHLKRCKTKKKSSSYNMEVKSDKNEVQDEEMQDEKMQDDGDVCTNVLF